MKHLYLIVIFFLTAHLQLKAQTCCSGGVPISSNVGLPAGDKGTFLFTLNYDLNVLKTLKEGSNTLEDDLRERKTQSTLLGVSYAISNRFSVDGFFSYVKQIRTITPVGLPIDHVETSGLGDAVFLIKYKITNPAKPATQVIVGLGTKLATGSADLRNDIGITLSADLQPGSGALDGIIWLNAIQNIKSRPTMNIIGTITQRITGENDEYFGSQVYELGDELQIRLGVSDRVTIGKLIFDPSLSLRYRAANRDINDNTRLVNTGGDWIFLIPAISYNIIPDLAVNATAEFPLYANVDGTQLSPSFRLNFGVFYRLNLAGNKYDKLKLDDL